MIMDVTVEGKRDSSVKSTPKRSFDVAFLTGNREPSPKCGDRGESSSPPIKLAKADGTTLESSSSSAAAATTAAAATRLVEFNNDPLQSSNGSAFKKVTKTPTNHTTTPATTTPATVSISDVLPASYPFSLPAFATTLSLQLLQQNTKGLAATLFNPMALLNAPNNKSYQPNLTLPNRSRNYETAGATHLIEDYLRAHASLYQEKTSDLANKNQQRITQNNANNVTDSLINECYTNAFHSAVDHHQRMVNRAAAAAAAAAAVTGPILASNTPVAAPTTCNAPGAPGTPVLPAALATLSASSQNVCAKCNLSFRMTSDLVYHMRSQHRRESDPVRQKRQEKLRCPVCGESFRERHHLTRHMTSHQDREIEADKIK